jgi:hypothetical protein
MRYAVATVVIVAALGLGGLGGYVLHGQGTMRVLGSGTSSCGTWLADRSDPFDSNWVNGYLTGYQDGGAVSLTERQTSDVAARSGWIDNYCQANPLNDLTDAIKYLPRAFYPRQP